MSSYAPPVLAATGLTLPTYQQILNLLTSNYQAIYGPGIYLGIDSADYQAISAHALAIADTYAALQLVFNNMGPSAAVGPALDLLIKNNGLTRKGATFSSCVVIISGVPNTVINNGTVRDSVPNQGFIWDLPPVVIIPSSGSISVTAVCETIGSVNALGGQINLIAGGLTLGWNSVTNPNPAVIGQAAETDAQLRARQAISTQIPSITMLAGTIAAIAGVPGVTRYNVFENPTGGLDIFGTPAHSLTCVVEGGDQLAVATAIYANRGIGPLTNGTTAQTVIDPNSGNLFTVNFYRPTYVPIYIIINIHPLALYSSAIGAAIQTALLNYLNSLQIGELITQSALVAAAMSATPNLQAPTFTIRQLYLSVSPAPLSLLDISVLFYQVAQGVNTNIQINLA